MVRYVDSKASKFPVVLTAHFDPGLTRWRSLVKWFLSQPPTVDPAIPLTPDPAGTRSAW